MRMSESDSAEQDPHTPLVSFPSLGEFKFKNDTSHKYRVFFDFDAAGAVQAPPAPGTPSEGDALLPEGLAVLFVMREGVHTMKAYVQDVTNSPLPDANWWVAEWQATGGGAKGADWIFAEGAPNDQWPITVLPADGVQGSLVHRFQPTTQPAGT